MGLYLNKGNRDFVEARNSDYVDKSGLIAFVNSTLSTNAKMTCVSRARRFGKSLALQMLSSFLAREARNQHCLLNSNTISPMMEQLLRF